jgi:hypothetical protein
MTKATYKPNERGSALLLTLVLSTIALAILAGVMTWSSSSSLMTHHSTQYNRSVAAGEAATERVISNIAQDFLYGGESLVVSKLGTYRASSAPTAADSTYWATWKFDDGNGGNGATYVQRTPGSNYVVLDSTYAGLKGYVSTYIITSHASDSASLTAVNAGVSQQLQLAGIPIFQFAMYSSGNMEISCGQPFDVTGRVHSNNELFVEPDNALTFESGVTAVKDILFQRNPLDPRGLTPGGTVVYVHPEEKLAPVAAMTLPIGTTNTPDAIREIIKPPPPGEDPNSPLGRLRYYNECDMVITVSDTNVMATSGAYNGFVTQITNTDVNLFVSTTNFWDARENKTVESIDIDVGQLATWSQTNKFTSTGLPNLGVNFSSVYVMDKRNALTANQLGAVRVRNGKQLPPNGLTVATVRPLYVLGDYNQYNSANLGTANTTTTRPASFAADAVTLLSDAWNDVNSYNGLASRNASSTTYNAAILTGVVETTPQAYSGGMENFPRFLETWGSANVCTYNGSMVKMFPSFYATNAWNNNNNIYVPPKRHWAYDANFDSAILLPPKTPSLLKVFRSKWVTVPAGVNVASTP